MAESQLHGIQEVASSRMKMLLDAQFEALRANEDRMTMGWEDERAQFMRRLSLTQSELEESRRALAKLEGRYSSTKHTLTGMTQNYEHLYQLMQTQQKQQQQQQQQQLQTPISVAASSSSSSSKVSAAGDPVTTNKKKRDGQVGDMFRRQHETAPVPAAADAAAAEFTSTVKDEPRKIKRILSTRSAVAAVAAAFAPQDEKRRRLSEKKASAQDPEAKEDHVNGTSVAAGAETGRNFLSLQLPETARGNNGGPQRKSEAKSTISSSSAAAAATKPAISRQGSTSRQRLQGPAVSAPREQKYVQTHLSKAAREQLPGHTCDECAAFYKMQKAKGVSSQDIQSVLNSCSRHRQQWSPTTTPEGFWDMSVMSMPTPKPLKKRALDSGGSGSGGVCGGQDSGGSGRS